MPALWRPVAPRSAVRPDWPVLNSGSAQAAGLVCWLPASLDRAGLTDYRTQLLKVPASGGGVPIVTAYGIALDCNANDRGVQVTSPGYCNGLIPVTIVCYFIQRGAVTTNGSYFQVSFTNANTAPFQQYALQVGGSSASDLSLNWNAAGTLTTITGTGTAPAVGTFNVLAATIRSGAQALWLNGRSIATGSTAAASISIGTTPKLGAGVDATGTLRTCGASILDCRLYKRVLADAEIRALSNPVTRWDLYTYNRQPTPWFAPPVAAGGADTPQVAQMTLMGVM